jgi:hypothetical protein
MSAIQGFFSALAAIVVSLTRSVSGLLVLFVFCLCLPLSMAALMHLLEWHWGLALAITLVFVLIPVLGWIALIVFGCLGAFFLLQTGFDLREATHPVKPPGSFATMTIMEFDAYRRNVMPEGLAKACKEAQSKLLGTGDQLPVRASNYCDCYGQTSADTLTQADLIYRERTGAYTEEATGRMRDAVHLRCGT